MGFKGAMLSLWGDVIYGLPLIKNPNLYWYLAIFLSEADEARQCYLFWKRLIKLKCPNLLNVLLPFLNLSWPSWTSKCNISSLHTLYECTILSLNHTISDILDLKSKVNFSQLNVQSHAKAAFLNSANRLALRAPLSLFLYKLSSSQWVLRTFQLTNVSNVPKEKG